MDVARADDFTVATWLKTWYDLYAKPNVRVATADRYDLMINTYTIPRIGNIKLTKLTSRDLQKLYKDLMEKGRERKNKTGAQGLSSTTVRSVHLMLHCAFERAVKERLIPRNPTDDCIAPMKALYHRFEMPSRRAENLDRKIKRTHNQLTRLLDKPGRKLLLRIVDMEDELRDEACLSSFISGYRLAQGIQQELLADQPPYSFEAEDERQACESWERRDKE